jgi:hypothetical protein
MSYVERVNPEKLPPGAEAIQGDPVDYVDGYHPVLLTGMADTGSTPSAAMVCRA